MDLSGIKNIIFDLGGVILDIDVVRTIQGFEGFGLVGISDASIVHSSYPFLEKYETGRISTEDFRNELRKAAGTAVADESIDAVWNDMLVGFEPQKIDLLRSLRPQYRLFLLSNTNAMHEVMYNKMLREATGVDNLSELFDAVFYSHRINMRKPDREIFEHVLKTASLVPEETLFIDDSRVHIESASQLGIVCYHLAPGDSLLTFFAGQKGAKA